jgi:hypothetical protein
MLLTARHSDGSAECTRGSAMAQQPGVKVCNRLGARPPDWRAALPGPDGRSVASQSWAVAMERVLTAGTRRRVDPGAWCRP